MFDVTERQDKLDAGKVKSKAQCGPIQLTDVWSQVAANKFFQSLTTSTTYKYIGQKSNLAGIKVKSFS